VRFRAELHERVLHRVGGQIDVAEQPPRVPQQRQLVEIDGLHDPAVGFAAG
jgi:hypothetical protein